MKHKKLTITVEEDVYNGLHQKVGRGNISSFINRLAKPYVVHEDLINALKEMASDKEREKEAEEWSEGLIGDLQFNDEYKEGKI